MPIIEARIKSVQKDTSVTPAWFRIGTDHPEVKRLDTKDDDKAKEAWELMQAGERASIEFTSKPRTLEDGRTFQNYYYERAAVAKNGSSGIPEIPAQPARKTDPGDAWRITLAASSKLAVASVEHLAAAGYDVSLRAQQEVALAWADFLYFTPPPAGPRSRAPEPESFAGFDPGTEAPPNLDDDIPF